MSLILYHHNSSVCAAKVRVALAEKNLAWEGRLMTLKGDQFDPAYLKLNPNAVVPTLVHDGRAVIESNVILEYLDDTFPAPPLRPVDPAIRARMRLWMAELEQGENGVHRAISVLTYAVAYRHHLIAEAGSEDPETLRAVIARNMNPLSREWLEPVVIDGLRSMRFGQALRRMDRLLGDFETTLEGDPWLARPDYSLADIAFLPYMVRLDLLQMELLWQSRPQVSDWYDRMKARGSAAEIWGWYHPEYLATLQDKGRAAAPDYPRTLAGRA